MPRTRHNTSRERRRQRYREIGRGKYHYSNCVVSGCTMKVVRLSTSMGFDIHTIMIPGGTFDLAKMTATLPTVVYKPNTFPGASTKIELPNGKKVDALFYSSGRLDLFGIIPPDYISEVLMRFLAIFHITLPYVDAKPAEP